ncbi:MAG: divalent-cation tolerance protein CutA [Alphaproteobacteria bacterium]
MKEELCLIYTLVEDKKDALSIAHALLKAKLAACINIVPQIHSVYLWKGKLCDSEEIILLVKTTSVKKEKVINFIKEMHPYEGPALFSIDTSHCLEEFLHWVSSSVNQQA